MLNADVDIGRA